MWLCSNRKLQQGYLLVFANVSLLQAKCSCMLITICSKVFFYRVLIFLCCKPYIVEC